MPTGEEFDDRRSLFRALYRTSQPLPKAAKLFGLTAEEMGLALHYAALSKSIQAIRVDEAKAAEKAAEKVMRALPITPPPAQRIAWDGPAPSGRLWCDQCDQMRDVTQVDACSSQWCKAKEASAA